jgi:hypothetical protein
MNSSVPAVGASLPLPANWRWGLKKLSLMLTSALRPPLARLPFIMFMTITPLLLLSRALIAVHLVDRLAILVANRPHRRSPQAWVRRGLSLALYGLKVMSAYMSLYGGLHVFPSVDFLWGVASVMQRFTYVVSTWHAGFPSP